MLSKHISSDRRLNSSRSSRLAFVVAAMLAVGALGVAADDARGQVSDHFTCYKAKTASGTPTFVPITGVSLIDAFRSSTVVVKKPKLLCAPTNKEGEDPTAPSHPDHLEGYQIKPTVKFPPVSNLRVVDQFGELHLDLKKPVALQVPTAKSWTATPPVPTNPAVDHFTCYKAKVTSGTPKFVRVSVTLEDQFGPMTALVIKPRRFCLPTNKRNEEPGAENHPDHLMCYKIKQLSHPRFVTIAGLHLNNQFGPERVDAKKPAELCVLASRNPTPLSTPTPTLTPALTSTATPTFTPAVTSTPIPTFTGECPPTPTSTPTPAYAPTPIFTGDLLGGSRGGQAVWDFCFDKSDDTPVSLEPRSLVQPGVNDGKAVHFNTWWKNCHVDPEAVQEVGAAATCGELRERFYRGELLLDTGSYHVGGLFTGTDPDSSSRSATFTADQYNQIWQVWGGYLTRPDNFDELAAERYGSAFGPSANPYPLPGEDPNLTNGGSGRLPEMFTQMRDDTYGACGGNWSSEITVTCHACHSGGVGTPGGPGPGMTFGGGSSLADLNLFLRDFLTVGYEASAATVLNLNRTRGRNNASLVNLAFAMAGIQGPDVMAGVVTSGSTADMDTPAWWNMGHRAVKFVDGVFPMDAPRIDAIFYAPSIGITETGKAWMRENGPDLNQWVESLKAPAYPFPVDTALAEEGAVLFHTLDMWAPERNNPIPRPEKPSGGRAGNGSCASCHGAYAPRYVQDPDFLDTPELEGIAAYIAPLDIIGTDPERVNANNESVQQAGETSFFAYPPTVGTDQDCGPQNREELRGDREPGYLAPPLYGVWASPPYFHNGSVPNVWEVLKAADRQQIWRRVSKPVPPEQAGCPTCSVIMGYDTDLGRAYDTQKLGWRYDAIPCEVESVTNPSVSPYVNCNPDPSDPNDADPLAQQILAQFYSGVLLGWNLVSVPPLSPTEAEERKIYNTRMFAQGNEGHEFNSVLTDAERQAIIEYLKTL